MILKRAIVIKKSKCNNIHLFKFQGILKAIYFEIQWINMRKNKFMIMKKFKILFN